MTDFVIEYGVGTAPGNYGAAQVMPCSGAGNVEIVSNPTTATEATVEGDGRMTLAITAVGGSGWVEFGATPPVAVDTAPAIFIPENATRFFGPLPNGWKIDCINDS